MSGTVIVGRFAMRMLYMLVVCMLAIAGCGGADSGEGGANFSGRWTMSETITSGVGDWSAEPWTLMIEQSGSTLSFPGLTVVSAACDRRESTLSWTCRSESPDCTWDYSGRLDTDGALVGTGRVTDDSTGYRCEFAWTAVRVGD